MNRTYFFIIAIILVAGVSAIVYSNSLPGKYDTFAQCIIDSGTKMYGAWWCPHCQDQKKEFGKSWNLMESQGGYVECSTASRTQIQVCADAGITSYPTWEFSDGTNMSGDIPLSSIAIKTGCKL
jgi:hypothetical protein